MSEPTKVAMRLQSVILKRAGHLTMAEALDDAGLREAVAHLEVIEAQIWESGTVAVMRKRARLALSALQGEKGD